MSDRASDESASGDSVGVVARVDAALESLIPRYLDRRRDDADAIEGAVAAADWDAVQTLGHSMKGSGGGYGFDPITEIGASVEAAARERDAGLALEGASRLRQYLDAVIIEFVEE